jgi:hypothetical protein
MSADSGDGLRHTVPQQRSPDAAPSSQTARSLIIPIVGGATTGAALAVARDLSAALIAAATVGGSLVFAVWWWLFVTGRKPRNG